MAKNGNWWTPMVGEGGQIINLDVSLINHKKRKAPELRAFYYELMKQGPRGEKATIDVDTVEDAEVIRTYIYQEGKAAQLPEVNDADAPPEGATQLGKAKIVAKEKTAKAEKPAKAAKAAKAAKPAKAAKVAKSAETNGRGRKSQYMGKKIKVLAKGNPRREGSHGWKNFTNYKNGLKYEDWRELPGAGLNHLQYDIDKGFIELS